MTPEHSDYLTTVYPEIFSGRYGGFACGDGWFDILNLLCRNIQSHLRWKKDVPQVVAEQVKEKFGSLRFYYSGGDEYISGLVSMAEAMTEVTCEECGSSGTLRHGGWIRTLCDKHEEERQTNKVKETDTQ